MADAIERGDLPHLKEELGDLLFQVVFHAQMAQEQGAFDFEAVAAAMCEKLIRRHPHVFGGQAALTLPRKPPPGRTSRRKSAGRRRNPRPTVRTVHSTACQRHCRPSCRGTS